MSKVVGTYFKNCADVRPAAKAAVFKFSAPEEMEESWHAWSDTVHGGTSWATITWQPRVPDEKEAKDAEDADPGAMVLEGNLSTKTVRPLRMASNSSNDETAIDLFNNPDIARYQEGQKSSDELAAIELFHNPDPNISHFQARFDAISNAVAREKRAEVLRLEAEVFSAAAAALTVVKEEDNAVVMAEEPYVTPSLKRSGFAGASTIEMLPGFFMDLEEFTALRFRVRSDGRKYIVSLRTDNFVTGNREDLWQAFLFSPKDQWADIIIPMSRFLKTFRGRVLANPYEMNASRVVGMGMAIAGGGGIEPEGPFKLEVASITGLRLSKIDIEDSQRKAQRAWGATHAQEVPNFGYEYNLLPESEWEGEEGRMIKERKTAKWRANRPGMMLPAFLGTGSPVPDADSGLQREDWTEEELEQWKEDDTQRWIAGVEGLNTLLGLPPEQPEPDSETPSLPDSETPPLQLEEWSEEERGKGVENKDKNLTKDAEDTKLREAEEIKRLD